LLQVNSREDETNHTARGGGIDNNVPSGSIALSTSGEFPETPTELSTPVNEDLTLTSKAKRKKVRNYLKRKNKRTNSIAPSSEESLPSLLLQQDDNNITSSSTTTTTDENNGFTIIRNRNSRRQKSSNNIVHHNRSSWYIDRNNITSDIMGSKESHIIKENARPNSMVHYITHHGDNDDEEGEVVLTKCTTTEKEEEEENIPVHVEKVEVETGQHEECGTEGSNMELRRVAASLASLDSITSVLTDTTITAQDTENIENIITPAPPSIEVSFIIFSKNS
jgi:hypothetical protein